MGEAGAGTSVSFCTKVECICMEGLGAVLNRVVTLTGGGGETSKVRKTEGGECWKYGRIVSAHCMGCRRVDV